MGYQEKLVGVIESSCDILSTEISELSSTPEF